MATVPLFGPPRKALRPPAQVTSALVRGASALTLALGALVGGAGCNNQDSTCLTNREFFAQKVWGEVVSKTCIKCHGPDGIAAQQNSKMLLLTSSFPGFIDANYKTMTDLGQIQKSGTSWIIWKPTGNDAHGGGQVIQTGSPEAKILQEMVDRTNKPDQCSESTTVQNAQVTTLSPTLTLRKAALALVGRLPTPEELMAVEMGGESAMDPILDKMMTEETFFVRLKEMFNDVFLTNVYRGQSLGLLDDGDYPSKYWYREGKKNDDNLTKDEYAWRDWADFGVASEPLELVAHVVRENRPFSEILTANYVMVNPYSAQVYGLDPKALGFSDGYSAYTDFREAKLSVQRTDPMTKDVTTLPLPHAGVLTTTTWLHRYPTTDTNLNRARARQTFKKFLATDILKVAERPIDPSSVTSLTPTRDDPNCNVCHKIIDPVAATFQKWDANGRYQPGIVWPLQLPQPGYGQGVIDNVANYPTALGWLGTQVTSDARFVTSTVYTIYKGMTGQDPFTYPADDLTDFNNLLAAYTQQDATLRAVGDKFKSDHFNLKTLVKALVHSTAYRAVNGAGTASGALEGLGTGFFLSPEQLNRKITAVTRVKWAHPWDHVPWLLSDYLLLYGGIDNVNVVNRLTDPNGVMSNVALRMASEVACQSTAWDLIKPRGARTLFPYVEVSYAPEDQNGYPIPQAADAIRQNIRYLHAQVLGEELAADDPEIERTFQLYVKTYREVLAKNDNTVPGDCRGRYNPESGTNAQGTYFLDSDNHFTLKPWIAVMAYLLSDYRFLYE